MALQSEAAAHPAASAAWTLPASSHAWYSVVVLSLVSMMSNIDRGIVNLLVGSIKRDLHLSDTGIGLLVFHDEAMLRYALSGFTMTVGPVVLLLIFCAVKPHARAYQRMQTGGST